MFLFRIAKIMNKAILLHGTDGSSQSSWLQWLRAQLEEGGMTVWVPDLPNADYPSLQEWAEYVFEKSPFEIDDNTLIVGHSAGAVAALIIAQLLKSRVGQVISVASFKDLSYLHEKLNWHANDRFFDVEFDFEKIKDNCDDIVFIHSDDDPYCPLDQAEFLAAETDGRLIIIPDSGHFNTEKSERFKEFPEIMNHISFPS